MKDRCAHFGLPMLISHFQIVRPKHTLPASDIISSELDKLFHESLASWCGDSGFIPRGSISPEDVVSRRIPGSESSDPAGINNFLPVLLRNGRPTLRAKDFSEQTVPRIIKTLHVFRASKRFHFCGCSLNV